MEKEDVDASNPLNPGNFKKVKLLPDGAALFTRGMGMSCTWVENLGMSVFLNRVDVVSMS